MIREYAVTGMTCEHCERRVQAEVGAIDGVREALADAGTGVLRVTSDAPVDTEVLEAAIDEAGYELAGR